MTTDFSQADISLLRVAQAGGNSDFTLQKACGVTDETTRDILLHFFTRPFKNQTLMYFNEENQQNNLVFQHIDSLFQKSVGFDDAANQFITFFSKVTNGQNQWNGTFFIALFKNIAIDEEITEAIGFFYTGKKEIFLQPMHHQGFPVEIHEGIPVGKIDNACLVFNTNANQGYKALVNDPFSKKPESLIWINDFLKLKVLPDNFFATRNVVDIIAGFCSQLPESEVKAERTEQINIAQKASEYLKTHEDFDFDDFKETVIEKPEIKKAFTEFKNMYQEANEIELDQTFKISPQAVKDSKKYFRSVIKLDKNFHVYVHAKPEYIEKGYDAEKKLNFYKLFYNTES